MRSRSIPTQPRTARQAVVRNIIALLSRDWGTLTAANRAAWEVYADNHPSTNALGQQVTPSGENQFVGLNFFRLDWSAVQADTPPSTPPPAAISAVVGDDPPSSGTGKKLDFTVTGTAAATDFIDVQLAGPFQSLGRRATKSDYRHVAYIAGNLTTYSFTTLVEGSHYWARVRYIDIYGQETPSVLVQFTSEAAT